MTKTVTVEGQSGGIGLSALLGAVFLTLKLTNTIAWPWLWVLAPFWIPAAFAAVVIAILLAVVVVVAQKAKR